MRQKAVQSGGKKSAIFHERRRDRSTSSGDRKNCPLSRFRDPGSKQKERISTKSTITTKEKNE